MKEVILDKPITEPKSYAIEMTYIMWLLCQKIKENGDVE